MNATTGDLLTIHGVAARLGLSERAVDRLVRDGRLPCIKLPNGAVRFHPDDLAAWLSTFRRAADPLTILAGGDAGGLAL